MQIYQHDGLKLYHKGFFGDCIYSPLMHVSA